MGTASQWLTTEVDSTTSRGTTTDRSIVMSGTDTTVQTGTDVTVQTGTDVTLQTGTDTTVQTGTDTTVQTGTDSTAQTGTDTTLQTGTDVTLVASPVKTRTSTEGAVAVQTVTSEDEGYTVAFSVIIEGGLGTIPAGDSGPTPICQ